MISSSQDCSVKIWNYDGNQFELDCQELEEDMMNPFVKFTNLWDSEDVLIGINDHGEASIYDLREYFNQMPIFNKNFQSSWE